MLAYFDYVLREITGELDKCMGSMNLILFAEGAHVRYDFFKPLYSFINDDHFSRLGCKIYQEEFLTCFYLEGNKRADKGSLEFRKLLHDLRRKQLSTLQVEQD